MNIKNILFTIFPFLEWLPKLKNKDILYDDILAWITVALVVIPQSMAYAQLAWLDKIEIWLYTAFIWVIVAGLFWSSKQMSTGPVTIVSLMTASTIWALITKVWWTEIDYIAFCSVLALFSWVFYLLLSLLRLWVIVDFLSHPVVSGFTNAIAIITITSQLPKILWIHINKTWHYFSDIVLLAKEAFSGPHIATFLFWVLSILLLVFLKELNKKLPRVLILLIISISISYMLRDYWLNISIVWEIPNNLPKFNFPMASKSLNLLNSRDIINLFISAMIIWLIWFTETISVSKFISTKTKEPVSTNRELVWQWLANIMSSFFWWYWVAWSFSKSAVNMRVWAKTGFSSIVTWLIVLITILFFTKFLYYLPNATLAAIIIVAVFSLIKIDVFIQTFKADIHDGIAWVITFILTLLLSPNVDLWIMAWVVISLWLFIYRSMRPKLSWVSMFKDGTLRDSDLFWLKDSKKVSILRFDWSIFFANVWHFESSILEHIAEKKKIKYIILDMELVNNIDYTWQESLELLIYRLKEDWIKVYLTDLRTNLMDKLTKSWFIKKVWAKNIYTKVEDALEKIKKKLWKKKDDDIEPLEDYSPDKKKKPEIEKEVIKKIEKVNKE